MSLNKGHSSSKNLGFFQPIADLRLARGWIVPDGPRDGGEYSSARHGCGKVARVSVTLDSQPHKNGTGFTRATVNDQTSSFLTPRRELLALTSGDSLAFTGRGFAYGSGYQREVGSGGQRALVRRFPNREFGLLVSHPSWDG